MLIKLFTSLLVILILTGCVANSMKKTTHLEQGMTTSEVRMTLGEPDSSEFISGYMVWKYSLHKPWVGFIPHYLAFDGNKKLVEWQANMGEYYANQNLWAQSLPKQHNVDVNITGTINHQ